ncbi:cytochrome P450, partial [Hygrophoropsis aurantiaca]
MMFADLLAAVAFLVALLLLRRKLETNRASKGCSLPPGPPRRPLLGNLLHIPRFQAWHTFLSWKHQYGDLVYVETLGNGVLILNTMEMVTDLLEKRASIYSDRPIFTMVGELMGIDNSIPMLQGGAAWRQQRKMAHTALSSEAVKKYHTVQENFVAMYVNSLIDKPEDFIAQLRLTAGRIIMSVTYGISVQTADDVYITDAERSMELIGRAAVPGAFLVDLIPQLKYLPSWLPFNHIHSTGEYGRRLIGTAVERPFEHVQRERAKGLANP